MQDDLTDVELTLRQTGVFFDERFDASGNQVVGIRISVEIMDLRLHVDVPRIRTKDDLRSALAALADMVWTTANAQSLDA